MTKISVKNGLGVRGFEGNEYVVDLWRKFEGYEPGDIIIQGNPFGTNDKLPLELCIAIRKDGSLIFRSWKFKPVNGYFHVDNICNNIIPTDQQIDTVAGLYSGRINYEGLELSLGKTLLQLCPFEVREEEKRINKKIFLNEENY